MSNKLSIPEKHQLRIAKDTLRMDDAIVSVMGGMTKKEARDFLSSIGWSLLRIRKFEFGR